MENTKGWREIRQTPSWLQVNWTFTIGLLISEQTQTCNALITKQRRKWAYEYTGLQTVKACRIYNMNPPVKERYDVVTSDELIISFEESQDKISISD
jgi:hypothetical protein